MNDNQPDIPEEAKFAEEPSDQDKLELLQDAILSCEQNMLALQEQRDMYLNQLKRNHADFENYKKRAKREQELESQRIARNFLEQLIPILDNVDYALSALDPNHEIFKPILMIKENFNKVMENYGVSRIEPQIGDSFDPEIHQAISVVPADVDTQIIGHIARVGYAINSQVFRPSDVVVHQPK